MSHDADIAQAYRDHRTAERWRKERLTDRWRLAQAAATNHNLLHGPSVLVHATSLKDVGKRKLIKRART